MSAPVENELVIACLRKERAQLEEQIRDLVTAFEGRNGVWLTQVDVQLDRIEIMGREVRGDTRVIVRIEL